jgi:hypothetical protein
MATEAEEEFSKSSVWMGLLEGPFAWIVNLQISYLLVPWACSTGCQFILHLVPPVSLLLAGSGGLSAWHNWRQTGGGWSDDSGGVISQSRFMEALGLLMSSLFSLIILA